MKNGQMSESSRLFWTNKVSQIIENSIEIAIKLYKITNDKVYIEKAFSFSEKNKALLLLNAIQSQDITAYANIPVEVLEEEKKLKHNLNELTGKISNEENRCSAVREKMNDDASIWISGTLHNIFNIVQVLDELDFKVLNVITWQKTNPPPHLACRYFTHSTEQIIWARKNDKTPHYFNYELMKQLNGDKQMKDVWKLPAIAPWEKSCTKHPTQKPLSVLTRLILASTKPNAFTETMVG